MKRLALLLLLASAALMAQEQSGGESDVDKFVPWKWANFLILAGGIGYLMGRSLPAYFRSRTGEIQEGILTAQAAKKDAERRAAEMDARLNSLGSEIEKFRVQAHAEMEQEGERIRQETTEQMRKLEQHGALEIEAAGKRARRDLTVYAGELALTLAEQQVRSRLDVDTQAALVDNFAGDLRKQASPLGGLN